MVSHALLILLLLLVLLLLLMQQVVLLLLGVHIGLVHRKHRGPSLRLLHLHLCLLGRRLLVRHRLQRQRDLMLLGFEAGDLLLVVVVLLDDLLREGMMVQRHRERLVLLRLLLLLVRVD